MAFSATTEWDVRVSGSDANGGGFDTATTGTDYSQQDSPQVVYSDLVIGTTNTQLTSAAHPFTSAHVGNIINVTGGTGFTVQRVQIASVAGSTATCDKACGTASSTGGAGNLGGGLITIQTAYNLVVTNNKVHIKAGTYSVSASITAPTGVCSTFGYQTTHLDGGTKPLVTTATNSLDPLIKTTVNSITLLFENIEFSNTAATPSNCFCQFSSNWTSGSLIVNKCKAHGFSAIFNSDNAGAHFIIGNIVCYASELYGSQYCYSGSNQGGIYLEGCYVHNFTSDIIASGVNIAVNRCILATSSGYMINSPQSVLSQNSVFYKNTGAAIILMPPVSNQAQSFRLENCVIWGGTYSLNYSGSIPAGQLIQFSRTMKNNAIGGWSTARCNNPLSNGEGEITPTTDPFTNGAGGDFSLNSATGGGALLDGAGFGNAIPGVANAPGGLDVGAVQRVVPAVMLACPATSTARVGVTYSDSLNPTSGTPPYTFAITSGSLPPGLTLNTSSGLISGTPTTAGTYPYTAQVTDSTSATATANCSITVAAPLTLSCPTSTATVGAAYSGTLVVS